MSDDRLPADDYLEIQNLYARYNHASDFGDADGFAGCFAEAGVLRIPTVGVEIHGRATIHAYKAQEAAGRTGRYRRHWNGSLWLTRNPDGSARGRCYFLAYNGNPGSLPELADCGVYDDRIVREGGRWLFAERRLELDGTTFKPPFKS